MFIISYTVIFSCLYVYDMFHMLLSCDSLRVLLNAYMYVCIMYVCVCMYMYDYSQRKNAKVVVGMQEGIVASLRA
jgi:hypothetical protein